MKKINIKITSTILGAFVVTVLSIPMSARASVIEHNLNVGDSGPEVASLQAFLAQDQKLYSQGLVTGYYGFLTQAAVSNFQARNGIAAIGIVGPSTLSAINFQMINGIDLGIDASTEIPTTYLSVHQ